MKLAPVPIALVLIIVALNATRGATPVHATPDLTVNPVTVDGKWTTPDEWSDAQEGNLNPMYARVKNDANFLYVLLELLPPVNPIGDGDKGAVYFDPAHDQSSSLQADDFACEIVWSGGVAQFHALGPSGGAWVIIPVWPGAQGASSSDATNDPYTTNAHPIYEFKIPMSLFSGNKAVGAAAEIVSSAVAYTAPGGMDPVNPSSWVSLTLRTEPHVPSGFKVRQIALTGEELNDILPGQGAFGDYLYYHAGKTLYRVDPSPGTHTPEVFAQNLPEEAMLAFGFDGDLFVAGNNGAIARLKPDGSVESYTVTGSTPTQDIEGIAFADSILYTSTLEGQTIYKITAIDETHGAGTVWSSNGGGSIRCLVFGRGGGFGTGLYTLNEYTSGEIQVLDQNGQSSVFLDNWSPAYTEYLAFGDPTSSFGDYMYVTVGGLSGEYGRIYRISASKDVSTFAYGFEGFSTNGVNGIKFSNDGETLFVTDDNAGIVYAIDNVPGLAEQSSPVGGYVAPSNGLVLLAPYLVLIGLIGAVGLLGLRKELRN